MRLTILKKTGGGILFSFLSIWISVHINAQEPDPAILKLLPDIPAELTEPAQRADYITLHFWDKFNFGDTTFLMKDHLLERCFVDYLDILSLVSPETTQQSVHILLKKSEETRSMFALLLNLSEKYLYEPTSPVCNEEKLFPFLRYALQSPLLNEYEKIRPNFLLENIQKNRIGNPANDFTYTLINGEAGNLYTVNTAYTLLYFNDPGCEDCQLLTKKLSESAIVTNLLQDHQFTVLMVYVNDDMEAWEKHAEAIPDSWMYTRDADQKINSDGIYNIKEFPTLYLLDKDKKVLLKDTRFDTLESYLTTQNTNPAP